MFHDFFFNGMWFGWVFWIVIIGVIVWAILNAGSKSRGQYPPFPSSESPLEILKKRYAKGEINKEQFEQMKKDIAS